MDTAEKALFLILGWIFGLLSPLIVDSIRRRRDIRDVRSSLRTEIHELHYRLACAAYYIEMRNGLVTRNSLEWLKPILQSYRGLNPVDGLQKSIDMQLALTDEELNAFVQSRKVDPGQGLSLKKYQLPLLDSKLTYLSMLSTKSQNQLLELKTV